MTNLFAGQTPASRNFDDGTPGITLGTTEVFDEDGTVTGVWFYATQTVSGSYSVGFWRVDSSDPGGGTQLAGKALGSAPTADSWNYVAFDAPVSVTAGIPYRATQFSGAGRYVVTTSYPWPVSNGGSTGVADGATVGSITVSQGTFRIDASADYPNADGNSSCYFVASDYVGPVTAAQPDGIAVPVALGGPATSDAISTAPDGIAVPVALGEPATSDAITTAPDGIAVAVALGSPSVDDPLVAAPDGIAVPVALGEPSIVSTVYPDGIRVTVELGAPEVTRLNTAGGGWHDFAGILAGAQEDARINAERRRNPVECPEHGWPLETNSRGVKHCNFGGHIVTGSPF